MIVRPVTCKDHSRLFEMIDPVFKAGETYAIDRDMDRDATLAYWMHPDKQVFGVETGGKLVGTYYLMRNFGGGGSHICNCGYITDTSARGQGVARLMLDHSLNTARASGYRAMMYNAVVSTNTRAVAIWKRAGFQQLGRVPDAFHHPEHGYVDTLIMFRKLSS